MMENFLPLRETFLPLRQTFLPLRENFLPLWEKKFGVPFKSDIKIYKENLYLINSNSKIYSINLKNGKLNWSLETSSQYLKDDKSYQLAIFNNKLFKSTMSDISLILKFNSTFKF